MPTRRIPTAQLCEHHRPCAKFVGEKYALLDTTCLRQLKSRGVGDTIAKLADASGIAAIVDATGVDCGCAKRRELLNTLLPYRR